MKEVDILTISADGGAYPAAFRFAKAGKDVVVVNSKKMEKLTLVRKYLMKWRAKFVNFSISEQCDFLVHGLSV